MFEPKRRRTTTFNCVDGKWADPRRGGQAEKGEFVAGGSGVCFPEKAVVKIFWTRQAVSDLNSALDCAACGRADSGFAAAQVIVKSVESLLLNPDLGRPGCVKGTRGVGFSPERPFFSRMGFGANGLRYWR